MCRNINYHVLSVSETPPKKPSNTDFEMFGTGLGVDALFDDSFGKMCTNYKRCKFNWFKWTVDVDVFTGISPLLSKEKPAAVNENPLIKKTTTEKLAEALKASVFVGPIQFFKKLPFYVNWDKNLKIDPEKKVTVKDITSQGSRTLYPGRRSCTFYTKVPDFLRQYYNTDDLRTFVTEGLDLNKFFYNIRAYGTTYSKGTAILPSFLFGSGSELFRTNPDLNVYAENLRFMLRVQCSAGCTFAGYKSLYQQDV